MVWFGLVWYGLVWFSFVWFGVVEVVGLVWVVLVGETVGVVRVVDDVVVMNPFLSIFMAVLK